MPGADVGPTYSKSLILKGPKMGRVSKNGCFEKFWGTLSKKFHFFFNVYKNHLICVQNDVLGCLLKHILKNISN